MNGNADKRISVRLLGHSDTRDILLRSLREGFAINGITLSELANHQQLMTALDYLLYRLNSDGFALVGLPSNYRSLRVSLPQNPEA